MNPIDENTIKECNNCAPKGLEYSQTNGRPQVMISEDYMREARDGMSYMQQASMLAEMMAKGEFGPEQASPAIPSPEHATPFNPTQMLFKNSLETVPTMEGASQLPRRITNFTLAETDAADVLPLSPSPYRFKKLLPALADSDYLPYKSEGFIEDLDNEAWGPYPAGPVPTKRMGCGNELIYHDKVHFRYTRLVKEDKVSALFLSGNWNEIAPFITSAGHGWSLPPDEVKKYKEKRAEAEREARLALTVMDAEGASKDTIEYFKNNLSKKAIVGYLDDILTSDTECLGAEGEDCRKHVELVAWYAILKPTLRARVDLRLADPQPVDGPPDGILYDVYAQVVVTVDATIECVYKIVCEAAWF